ncbi:hypothetical protein H7Y63_03855 [Polaromonas sp.]|nr:hypothetical protein [Candidatus Saccharibacteria bacterium]
MAGQFNVAIESQRQDNFVERTLIMDHYLADLPEGDLDQASAMAESLLSSGKPLANTVVIIPVAAHQEAANVAHTIDEYAKQQDCEPFTVVLGLNAPWDQNGNEAIAATEGAVNNAMAAHPNLDIRFTSVFYDEPVIGEIRRDLWNGVLLASQRTGNYDDGTEIIGINHDIDLIRLSPNYVKKVQQAYGRRDRRHIITPVSPSRGSLTKHAYSAEHPIISRTVFWNDYCCRRTGVVFEAGIIVPMSMYAQHGGFDPSAKTHEVAGYTDRSPQRTRLLPGTHMETSLRRYVARIDAHGYRIWSTDSFTANDECRQRQNYPDITRNRQAEIVRSTLPYYAGSLASKALRQSRDDYLVSLPFDAPLPSANELAIAYFVKAIKIKNQASGILSRVVQSEALAEDFCRLFADAVEQSIEIKIAS